jgi:hypothetical protein
MNKIIIALVALFLISFCSCNNDTNVAKTRSDIDTTPVKQNDSIQTNHPRVTLDSMKTLVRNFNSHFNRRDTIISKFNRVELIDLLNSMTDDSVKFVVGGHKPDEMEPGRRNKAVICLKASSTDKTTTVYYVGDLCPPPPGCNIEN